MILFAIDPGPDESAYVLTGDHAGSVYLYSEFGKVTNNELLGIIRRTDAEHLALEMVASYGMPVGEDVFRTVFWCGRFVERWSKPWTGIVRLKVKMCLCHDTRAKDANIRQALIDRFGGKDKAIGKKKTPGPLYGVKGDVWSALAVAVTWWDTKRQAHGSKD